jgi:uncharacterized protein (DUF1501 family)
MKQTKSCDCTRRSFLKGSGLTLAGFGLSSLFPGAVIRHAMAMTPGNKRLIFIFLRGGNDGLNAVIPHGDPDYSATNRPNLYIDPVDAIDLNGFASFHPKLNDLMEAFNSGELAVIHRVGLPNNTRSHFDDQRMWENGDAGNPQFFEGWLYRYIYEHALSQGVILPALSIQSTAPLVMRGAAEKYVNIANPNSFDYRDSDPKRSKYSDSWKSLYSGLTGPEAYRSALSDTGVRLVDTLDEYRSWDQANWDPKDPSNPDDSLFPVAAQSPAHSRGFPSSTYSFFRSLKVCALSLLESTGSTHNTNGTRVAGTQLNGFDTHNQQGQINGTQANLLEYLAYGLRSLRIVLSGAAIDTRSYPSIWNDSLVVTMSEFGRTSLENGSVGTDHAAASCLFAQGGLVSGGVYNCDPGTWPAGVMFGVNNRYLSQRTDYRSIFWEILRDHMGADPAKADIVFPGYTSLGLGSQELGVV